MEKGVENTHTFPAEIGRVGFIGSKEAGLPEQNTFIQQQQNQIPRIYNVQCFICLKRPKPLEFLGTP